VKERRLDWREIPVTNHWAPWHILHSSHPIYSLHTTTSPVKEGKRNQGKEMRNKFIQNKKKRR
jgi:hypothetical protein